MRSKSMALIASLVGLMAFAGVRFAESAGRNGARCTDPATGKPVDCVPATLSTFDIPFDKLPAGRMNASVALDKRASPRDAHAGAFVAAKKLGLFRNFEWIHWVPTAPSTKDPVFKRLDEYD